MAVQVHLDAVLAERGMTLTELSEHVGITLANLSILKTGKARAIRFSTLEALCRVLDCQPGNLLSYEHLDPSPDTGSGDAAERSIPVRGRDR